MSKDQLYTPTAEERANTLAKGDFLKVSGDGIFATLQGEGASAGAQSVFLRLQNCNLHCGANDQGWMCDAWYTWDRTTPEYWQETSNLTVDHLVGNIETAWDEAFPGEPDRRLVITGGEPLLQQAKILPLINKLGDWHVEIETNGTIIPDDGLQTTQINCSPKLATSGNLLQARYRPEALKKIVTFPNAWFKFVITGDQDIVETQEIVEQIGVNPERVLLMSEGTVAAELAVSDSRLAVVAKELGYMITARNHIFWYGDKRAT